MGRTNTVIQAFNRGRISNLGLARIDLDRVRLSAETQTNWVPRSLGSMSIRPGFQYLGGIRNDSLCRIIPFVFGTTDTALLEVTTTALRVWLSGTAITRAGSTAVITNGDFSSSNLTGWTNADEVGTLSSWDASQRLVLTGTRYQRARLRQTVTAAATTHGLSVRVFRGEPYLRVGSSVGADDYINERQLGVGHYSFQFGTTGNFNIELSANTDYGSYITSIQTESSGDMVLDTPWSSSDLSHLRWSQSNDVVFCACPGITPQQIQRFSKHSWATVEYFPKDGPFRPINITGVRLRPSAYTGAIHLYADRPFFSADHVGSLFQITSVGQNVSASFSGPNQASDYIRVAGVENGRIFYITITQADSSAPIYIQQSIGEPGAWQTIDSQKYTSAVATSYSDGLSNTIAFYRMYSPATASTALNAIGFLGYSGGGITGTGRVSQVLSSTETLAYVLTAYGDGANYSELWSEGCWSPLRGYPSAVSMHEGRVFWAGKNSLWGSVSGAFNSFDDQSTTLGDDAPINLIIAGGSNDSIQWLLSLTRLVLGTPLQELQAKTSSLEEPLTPTNFALRDISTQGSGNVQAIKVDQRALFVQAGGTRVMEVSLATGLLDFVTNDRTLLVPEVGEPQFVRMAVQRQPDTRVHCLRSDGTVGMLLTDPAEDIQCWLDIETNGVIEEAVVLPGQPGDGENEVYYVVQRTINGASKRYLEKWARENQSHGAADNRIADAFVIQESTIATTTVSGLSHLEGCTVVAWGSTTDLGSYTVTGGQITLSQASTYACVGLGYSAKYVSSKLAYAAQGGTALEQRKRVHHVGVVLRDTHAQGIQYGPSTDRLQFLPRIEGGSLVSTDSVWDSYDNPLAPFSGTWDTDSRVVLIASAPRPATVLGLVLGMETKEHV